MGEPTPETKQSIGDCLELYSAGALQQIAKSLGISPKGAGRTEHVTALSDFLGTSRHLDVLNQRLSDEDWSLLGILPLQLGRVRVQVLTGVLAERGIKGAGAVKQVIRLFEHGCFLPCSAYPAGMYQSSSKLGLHEHTFSYDLAYYFLQLTPGLAEPVWRHAGETRQLAPVAPPATVAGQALPELQRMAFLLLAEAGRKPIRLTNQATPYQADMTRLAKAIAADGGTRSKRGAGPTPAPPLLWFALASSFGAGLLEQNDMELQPSGTATEFFRAPPEEQVKALMSGWAIGPYNDFMRLAEHSFDVYGYGTPWFPAPDGPIVMGPSPDQLHFARRLIVAALQAVLPEPDGWYRLDELARFVFQQFPEFLYDRSNLYRMPDAAGLTFGVHRQRPRFPYHGLYRKSAPGQSQPPGGPFGSPLYIDTDWMEVEGALVRQVVAESLRWLGIVDVAADPSHPEYFRLTELGQHLLLGKPIETSRPVVATGKVVVQPSFEIVVLDVTANWDLLSKLDEFAERRSLDRAASYRLTQECVVRGLDRGWTGERIVETLQSASGAPLPQNVLFSIREWVQRYEFLTMRESATLLQADADRQLDRWLADRELAPLLGRQVSPTAVLVPARHVDAVAKRVRKLSGPLGTVDYSQKPVGVLKVQAPDLIELPAEKAEPYLLYRLGQVGTPVQRTNAKTVYRITKDSVSRAAQLGYDGERLLMFIEVASLAPLPIEIRARLLGWSGAVAPVVSEPLVALTLRSAPLNWLTLLTIEPIKALVRAVPAPEVVLVAFSDLPKLEEELRSRGIETEAGRLPDIWPVSSAGPVDRFSALRSLLKDLKEEPQVILDAMRAAGVLGRVDRTRGYY